MQINETTFCDIILCGSAVSEELKVFGYACRLLSVVYFIVFIFDPYVWGSMFLRNVGEVSSDYTSLRLRKEHFPFPQLWETKSDWFL
jgi:hypothetical protein